MTDLEIANRAHELMRDTGPGVIDPVMNVHLASVRRQSADNVRMMAACMMQLAYLEASSNEVTITIRKSGVVIKVEPHTLVSHTHLPVAICMAVTHMELMNIIKQDEEKYGSA